MAKVSAKCEEGTERGVLILILLLKGVKYSSRCWLRIFCASHSC